MIEDTPDQYKVRLWHRLNQSRLCTNKFDAYQCHPNRGSAEGCKAQGREARESVKRRQDRERGDAGANLLGQGDAVLDGFPGEFRPSVGIRILVYTRRSLSTARMQKHAEKTLGAVAQAAARIVRRPRGRRVLPSRPARRSGRRRVRKRTDRNGRAGGRRIGSHPHRRSTATSRLPTVHRIRDPVHTRRRMGLRRRRRVPRHCCRIRGRIDLTRDCKTALGAETTVLDIALGPIAWRAGAPKVSPTNDPSSKDTCGGIFAQAQAAVLKGDDVSLEHSWREYLARTAMSLTGAEGSSVSLVLPMALALISLVLLFVSAGYGIVGRPLGALIDDRNRIV